MEKCYICGMPISDKRLCILDFGGSIKIGHRRCLAKKAGVIKIDKISIENIKKGELKMDYKSVLEEQIKKLEKVQEENVKNFDTDRACETAGTILGLIIQANLM